MLWPRFGAFAQPLHRSWAARKTAVFAALQRGPGKPAGAVLQHIAAHQNGAPQRRSGAFPTLANLAGALSPACNTSLANEVAGGAIFRDVSPNLRYDGVAFLKLSSPVLWWRERQWHAQHRVFTKIQRPLPSLKFSRSHELFCFARRPRHPSALDGRRLCVFEIFAGQHNSNS